MVYYKASERKVTRVKKLLNRDMLTALGLFLLVLLLGTGLLDRGHEWGDDFAAYMLEARAIANGTMEEQSRINRIIHASEMSFGGGEVPDSITYVWGYPLALAGVYKMVGYEPSDGGIPIAYKLPNLAAYALFTAVIYLFYRRRFSFEGSLFLSLLFALHTQMLTHVNTLMSDVFCLTLSMAALLLAEIFFDCGNTKKKAWIGLLLGAVLWYNYEVRLNGVTVIYIVLFAHAVHLLRSRPAKREWPVQLAPYASLLLLLGISLLVMPQATSNTAHIASGPNSWIAYNLNYYSGLLREWIRMMIPTYMPLREYAHYAVYALIVVGMLFGGLIENLHLSALMLGTFAVVLLLPYAQPLRYLFNALPLMLLFAALGLRAILRAVFGRAHSAVKRTGAVLGIVLMCMCAAGMLQDVMELRTEHASRGGAGQHYDAYSEQALDIYGYIRGNMPQEAKIAFVKPRALTLNTGRMGFMPGINGNRFADMDYLLELRDERMPDTVTQSIWPELWEELTEVYRNDMFVLYELSESYRQSGKAE